MMSNIMLVDKDNTLFEDKKIAETFFLLRQVFLATIKNWKF